MFTTREDLSTVFGQYICSGWMEREKNAGMLIDQMFDMAKEGSVADLTALFGRHYLMESPLDAGELWKYLFNIKALCTWEDAEQMLNVYYMGVLHDWEQQAEKSQQPGLADIHLMQQKAAAKEVRRLCDLSMKEQAAFMRELEINTESISWEFFEKLTNIYPNLTEAFGFYLEFALREGDYQTARLCVQMLERDYPDDYEILKKKLDIYSVDGKADELHSFGVEAVNYLKKHPSKTSYDFAHYTGQSQLSARDYNGALETYSYLITNYSQLDSKIAEELRSQFSIFYEVFGMPAPFLKDKLMLFVIQFTFFLKNAAKEGVDLNSSSNASMLGNTVLRLSEKLSYPFVREPFKTLIGSCEEQGLLADPNYHNIITTGYSAVESFDLGDDTTIKDDIRQALLCVYNGPDGVSDEQAALLENYYNAVPSRKIALKESYPLVADYLAKVLKEKKNRQKNPYAGSAAAPVKRMDKKVGRNDPCPCGSGRKYKHCCGK